MGYKTTQRHFEIFKKECEKWINLLGMKDWEVDVIHAKLEDGTIANHTYDTEARALILRLGTDWGSMKVSPHEVRLSASHEVIEGRYSRIRMLAKSRFVREEEITEEIHALVLLFQNTVLAK